jgi:HK97 family phage major capsid protein
MVMSTGDLDVLLQSKVASLLIDPVFEQASTFLSLGVRIFQTATPLSIPTIGGHYDPGWVPENGLIPQQDAVEFNSVDLLPSLMESLKIITVLSRESLRMSSQALDAILQARLVADIAAKVDEQAWGTAGDGVTQPQGFQSWPELADPIDISGEYLVDGLMNLQGVAMAANIPSDRLRWVMSPNAFTSLRKMRSNMSYLIQPDVTLGTGLRLLGNAITLTSRVPDDDVYLIDPSAIAVAVDENPRVEVLRELYADHDQIGIKIVARLDWKPVQPTSIIRSTGVIEAGTL